MGETSGTPSNFIQRYLTQQPYSPEMYSQDQSFSMQDGEELSFTSRKRTMECQKILDRISTFCGKENLVPRVAFLDQELSVFGYPPIASDLNDGHDSSSSPGGAIDLVTLVNVSYDLLRCWRQSIESHGEASDLQRTSESEIVRLRHLSSRLKEDIANKDRDLKSKELMQLQLTQRLESLKKKLKLEQEKTKRLSAEMTARDSQFKHEKKKKIQEIEKLQSRLQQLLQDKRQERMLGIEILNSLQRADGKRGKWSTDKTKKNNEQDMYRLIITNYEDSQKQLLKENEGMRKYLKEMQNELISALNERNAHDLSHSSMQAKTEGQDEGDKQGSSRSSSQASNRSETSDVSEQMSDGMFEMPYDLVKEDIEKSIRTKWRALKKEIRKSRKPEKTPRATKESVGDNEYDDLVQQQQELIDYLTTGQGETSDRPIPDDCYFLEEKAELERQKNSFHQQKQAFDKERQVYAEALLQLDEQRQSFEMEKNNWFQQNFLQLTPFRNENRPSTSPHQNLRGKEPSSHHGKARQQPYQPRPSVSPDRPVLKASDQSTSYQSQGSLQSPNNISQSLSRLHSSSQHNQFSPETMPMPNRHPEPSWSSRTPENSQRGLPHKAKSTPNAMNSILPPTTAELYRTLGLVYYGSDKENEDVGNTGSGPQVCPRSSGTVADHSVSHYQDNLSRWNQQGRGIAAEQHLGSKFKGQASMSNFEGRFPKRNSQFQAPRPNFDGQKSTFESQPPLWNAQGQPPDFEGHPQRSNFEGHPQRSNFDGRPPMSNFGGQPWGPTTTEGHTSGPFLEGQIPSSNPEAFKVKIQSKIFPNKENHVRPPSPEYLSATASLESEGKSTSSDYFDAEKSFRDGTPRRGQKLVPREHSKEQLQEMAENCVESVSFMTNEFQISENVPETGARFTFSRPENRRLYSSKSMEEKSFKYGKQNDEKYEKNKPKKSGIRNFMRNLLLGSPKPRQHDINNNKTGNHLLSNSDSLLSLSYYLDRDVESGTNVGLHPSAGLKTNGILPAANYLSHMANLQVSHQRTRSFPGSEVSEAERTKPRSFSLDAPVLSAAAERHKSALLSMTSNMKPKELPRPNLGFPLGQVDFSAEDDASKSSATPNTSQNEFHRFKFDQTQFDPHIYEEWSHSNRSGCSVKNNNPQTGQSHPKPVSAGFNQMKSAQVTKSSDSMEIPRLESLGSNQSKPVPAVHSSHSFLEEISREQSYGSSSDDADVSLSESSAV